MTDQQYKLNLVKVGLKISYYRKIQGITQEHLAELCGLSVGYISQLEAPNLYFCPSLKTLFLIGEALHVHAFKFLDVEED